MVTGLYLGGDYPLFLVVSVGYTLHMQTHTHSRTHARKQTHTYIYESSFISWLSVLAIFLGGAGLSPSPCSCSLFFAAFCLTQGITQPVSENSFITIKIKMPYTKDYR